MRQARKSKSEGILVIVGSGEPKDGYECVVDRRLADHPKPSFHRVPTAQFSVHGCSRCLYSYTFHAVDFNDGAELLQQVRRDRAGLAGADDTAVDFVTWIFSAIFVYLKG
jgi:hypothetical protein